MAGLPRALAIKLAAQTMAGSGVMGLKTELPSGPMLDQVTSPWQHHHRPGIKAWKIME